jgi:hypothetical protein
MLAPEPRAGHMKYNATFKHVIPSHRHPDSYFCASLKNEPLEIYPILNYYTATSVLEYAVLQILYSMSQEKRVCSLQNYKIIPYFINVDVTCTVCLSFS